MKKLKGSVSLEVPLTAINEDLHEKLLTYTNDGNSFLDRDDDGVRVYYHIANALVDDHLEKMIAVGDLKDTGALIEDDLGPW